MTITTRVRNAAWAVAFMAAAMALPGCVEPSAVTCSSGIYCPAGSKCAARQAICIFDDCGDGLLQPGESCDDGNRLDGDGCSANCKSNETCGNGVIDDAMGEVCDDGNTTPGDGCSADCKSIEGCGNGKVDLGEECDAGPSGVANMAKETSSCNSNCKVSRCGDGIVNRTAGEGCDRAGDGQAGTSGQSASCNVDCTASVCGDGTLNPLAGESCDRGLDNGTNRDCLPTCQPNVCGDLYVNETRDQFNNPREECDDGANNSNTGACLRNCQAAICGDGHVRSGVEGCDEGPGSASVKTACPYGQKTCVLCSACQSVSLLGPACGDGIRQSNAGEACDDGLRNGATTCNYGEPSCQICSADCSQLTTYTGPYCGDGIRNGSEVCDDGNNVTETRCPYGTPSCTLCNATCSAALVNLKGSYCGDGVVNTSAGEQCDNSTSMACGTCDECQFVSVNAATGTITVESMDTEGTTITLDDGIGDPITLELDTVGGCAAGRVCVDLATASTTPEVARRIGIAIGQTLLDLDASVAAGDNSIALTNYAFAGIAGNRSIGVSAPNGAIVADGMKGGIGCPPNALCQYSSDCASGNGCKTNHMCR